MCGSVDLLKNIYIFFTKKDVTRILSVLRSDISCGEFLGIIQSQAIPWMGGFITRVLVNFDENLTH
jgi:hypothetical protein